MAANREAARLSRLGGAERGPGRRKPRGGSQILPDGGFLGDVMKITVFAAGIKILARKPCASKAPRPAPMAPKTGPKVPAKRRGGAAPWAP
jgi:hypothetical protein